MTEPNIPLDELLEASCDTGKRPRVLMLTHRLPYPPDRGDRIRAYNVMRYLAGRCDLSLACASVERVSGAQLRMMYKLARRVAVGRVSPWGGRLRGAASLARGGAVTPAYHFSKKLGRTIRRWHAAEPFDVVLTYCTGMIRYARLLTQNKNSTAPRHVIDLVDVDSVKWAQYAKTSPAPLRWVYAAESARLREIEAGRHDHFDALTVVSEQEAEAYRRHVGLNPRLAVVRNGVDLDYFQPMPDVGGKTIVFVGVLNYKPNVDGVRWFVERVMPRLSQRVEGVGLKIVGRHPAAEVTALAQRPGVEVVGSVADVRDYLREAVVVVAPLQIARGVQNKVLEAMACQRAVVCSPQAAGGTGATPGLHLLVAATPEEWVDRLQAVVTDPAQRIRLSTMGRGFVEQSCRWERCLEPLGAMLGLENVAGDETTVDRRVA